MKQFIFKPMVLVVVVLTAVAGSGCTGSISEPPIWTKVTLGPWYAEYKLVRVDPCPCYYPKTQDECGYFLRYEAQNGGFYEFSVRKDPVTGELQKYAEWGDIATLQKPVRWQRQHKGDW